MEEVVDLEEALKIVQSSLSQIRWRLKPSSKRRLETESSLSSLQKLLTGELRFWVFPNYGHILALCSGMRAVIMVDYGGKMPELQERLCSFMKSIRKESFIFKHLQVMVIEDMIYLIHVKGISKLVNSSLSSKTELHFVDLEQDPPKMITKAEKSPCAMQLTSVQELFSSFFPADGLPKEIMQCHNSGSGVNADLSVGKQIVCQSSECIDLSRCMQDTQITVPTLNGWLLGYPVVYLFGKDHISDAIYNLSTKSLHIYRILVCRNGTSDKGSCQEELMSFSVPYDLSLEGSNEPWAKTFLASMQSRWEVCKQVWGSLQMEVSGCYPQAIAL